MQCLSTGTETRKPLLLAPSKSAIAHTCSLLCLHGSHLKHIPVFPSQSLFSATHVQFQTLLHRFGDPLTCQQFPHSVFLLRSILKSAPTGHTAFLFRNPYCVPANHTSTQPDWVVHCNPRRQEDWTFSVTLN